MFSLKDLVRFVLSETNDAETDQIDGFLDSQKTHPEYKNVNKMLENITQHVEEHGFQKSENYLKWLETQDENLIPKKEDQKDPFEELLQNMKIHQK